MRQCTDFLRDNKRGENVFCFLNLMEKGTWNDIFRTV